MLKRITSALAHFSKFMSMATLAAMASLVLFQIFKRLFIHITVIWTKEFCRYILVSLDESFCFRVWYPYQGSYCGLCSVGNVCR